MRVPGPLVSVTAANLPWGGSGRSKARLGSLRVGSGDFCPSVYTNHPPEPAPTACQSLRTPDSKSSMTNLTSPWRTALLDSFGSSSPAVMNTVNAADTISAPATADASLNPLSQRRDHAEAPP